MGSAMGNAALTQRQGSRQSGDSVQVRINKMRNTDVGKNMLVYYGYKSIHRKIAEGRMPVLI